MEKQSKIIVVSDLHYGLGKNSKNKLKILKEYVEPSILKELSDSSYQNTLIICGDLFHEMVSVRTDIYKESRLFLERCCSTNSNVILIAGNHDCYDESTDVTSVELFDQIVDVVRYPREMTFGERKYLLLPWSDNNAYAFRYEDEKYDGVFCHPDVPKEFFSYVWNNIFDIELNGKYRFDSFPLTLKAGAQCVVESSKTFSVSGEAKNNGYNTGNQTTITSSWSKPDVRYIVNIGFDIYY